MEWNAVTLVWLLCKSVHLAPDSLTFDLIRNGNVNLDDVRFVIDSVLAWPIGDSNGDGLFDSRDFVAVFQTAEYEDGRDSSSIWSTGDWNCDGEFSSEDFVAAFQGGSYRVAAKTMVARSVQRHLTTAALTDLDDTMEGRSKAKQTNRRKVCIP